MSRTVVSLTTIPERVKLLPECLKSLMNQTTQPSCIYLNIPEDRPFDMPTLQSIVNQADPSSKTIVINRVPQDLGPITKLVPTLDREPKYDTNIILVDDDVIYNLNLISELTAPKYNDIPAIGLVGRTKTLEYKDKPLENIYLLETFAGVRYRRSLFPATSKEFLKWVEDMWKLNPDCKFTDDIIIAVWINQTAIPLIIGTETLPNTFNSKDTPQLRDKNLSNRNASCMHSMIKHSNNVWAKKTIRRLVTWMLLVVFFYYLLCQ